MTTCPDCFGPVGVAQLLDPAGTGDAVTIWDCPACQRTGFVMPAPREPEPIPAAPPRDDWFLPGSTPPAGAGEYPPRGRVRRGRLT
jgi:hypothetical protein